MGVYHTLYKCIRLNCHLFDQEWISASASPHQSLSLSNIVFVVDHFHFPCWSFENIFPGVPGAVWGRQANPCVPSGITNMKITIIIWKNYQLIICIFRYYQHEAMVIDQHCSYGKIIILWSGWGRKLLWRPSCPYQSYPPTDKGVSDDKSCATHFKYNNHIMIFTINYFEVVIVETREADCIFRSVLRGDGGMEVIIIILISIIWRLYFIDIYIICLWNQYKNRSWTKTTRRLWPVFAAGFLVCRKIIFFLSAMMIMIYLRSWHNYNHIHDIIMIII